MADFSVDFSQAQGAGANPVSPIEPYTGKAPNPWPELIGNAAKMFMQYSANKEEAEKKKAQDDIISSFVKEQTAITDAVNSGQMTRSQAAVRQRATTSKYFTQYPTMVKGLQEVNKNLLEGTELGEFKEAEQSEQDIERDLTKQAISAGYPITPDMNPATKEQFLATYQMGRRKEAEAKEMREQARFMKDMNEADMKEAKYMLDQRIALGLSELGGKHVESTVSFVGDLAKEPDKAIATQKLNAHFALLERNIATISATNPSLASNWNKLFGDLKKYGEDALSGKVTSDALENYLKEIKTKSQIMALETDPGMQGLYAVNALIPHSVAGAVNAAPATIRTLARFTSEGGVTEQVVGTSSEKPVYEGIKKGISILGSGASTNPELLKKNVATGIDNTLKQVEKSLALGIESKDLKEAFSFIASSDFATANEMKLVKPQQASVAKQVFQTTYEREVSGAVSKVLGKSVDGGVQTFGDLVSFEFAGDGVVIKPLDRFMTAEQSNMRARLTNEVKPAMVAINQLIKAGTHLEGHRDYAQYWEENKQRILPEYFGEKGEPKRVTGRDTGIQPIKQVVPEDKLVANKTVIGGYMYIGGTPGNQSSWKKVK